VTNPLYVDRTRLCVSLSLDLSVRYPSSSGGGGDAELAHALRLKECIERVTFCQTMACVDAFVHDLSFCFSP
jgi:hypothetical protein